MPQAKENFMRGQQKSRELKLQISAFFKFSAGNELSSQAVARQVFLPLWVFTTVFGMGTGGLLMLGHQRFFCFTLEIAQWL